MAWQSLNKFGTKYVQHSPFEHRETSKIIYFTKYDPFSSDISGIFEYDVKNHKHKTLKLWQPTLTNYYPQYSVSIYNPAKHEIIFVGGRDNKSLQQCYKQIMIYNIKNGSIKNININIKIGLNTRLALTYNGTRLHIIGGSCNKSHIIYDLLTNTLSNIHTFSDKIDGHGVIYNKLTNTIIMFGGITYSNKKYFDHFFVYDVSNGKWIKNEQQKMIKKLAYFGYVLYDNRIIITFGGRTDGNKIIDSIHYLDLFGNDSWKESQLKCAKKGLCNAVIVDDKKVHIMPYYEYSDHFVVDIGDILPSALLKKEHNSLCKYGGHGDEEKKSEISANLISDVQQRLDIQQARLDSLTTKLEAMQNHDALMAEMNNKITILMTKMNEWSERADKTDTNIAHLQQQYNKLSQMEEQKVDNTVDNTQMIMQQVTALQHKFDMLSKMQISGNKEDKKEQTEREKLKLWFTDTLRLPQYLDLFDNEGYEDLESIKHITMNDLDIVGITKHGHKQKIIREVHKLKNDKQPQQHVPQIPYYQQQQQQYVAPKSCSIEWMCYNCNTQNDPNAIFCKICGVNKNSNINVNNEVDGPHLYDTAQ